MSDLDIFSTIQALSDDYANNHISFTDYRMQRRALLEELDKTFNQVKYPDEIDEVFLIEEQLIEVLDDE
jgi:hypothetical protein